MGTGKEFAASGSGVRVAAEGVRGRIEAGGSRRGREGSAALEAPKELLHRLEKEYLLLVQAESGGDVKAMAARLGVTDRALYKRFQLLGIPTRGGGRKPRKKTTKR